MSRIEDAKLDLVRQYKKQYGKDYSAEIEANHKESIKAAAMAGHPVDEADALSELHTGLPLLPRPKPKSVKKKAPAKKSPRGVGSRRMSRRSR